MKQTKTSKIALVSILAALSVVLGYFVKNNHQDNVARVLKFFLPIILVDLRIKLPAHCGFKDFSYLS